MAGWHRLHPLSPLVRSGRHLTGLVIFLIVLLVANTRHSGGDFISEGAVILVVLVAGIIAWAVTRWRVDRGVLYIETGLIRRQSLRFPLSQAQAIDVVQTGLARTLGLASIQLRMAGADSSNARLIALRRADAQALREQLLSMAKATATPSAMATPQPWPPLSYRHPLSCGHPRRSPSLRLSPHLTTSERPSHPHRGPGG